MNDSLIEFPNEFPVKVVGVHSDSLRPAVEAAVTSAGIELISVNERASSAGNYLSLTVTVIAKSQDDLDALYRGFTDIKDVKWVL